MRIMSDNATKSCEKASDVNIVLDNVDMSESRDTYKTQWMARWTRARSSSTSHSHIHRPISNERNTDHKAEKGCLLSENMSTLNPGVIDLTLDVLQPEAVAGERRFKAMKGIAWSIDSKAVQTDSENFDSEWKHFPMFDINRKREYILSPKRKYGYGPMALKTAGSYLPLNESKTTLPEKEFVTEEHQFHTWGRKQITDMWTGSSKSIKGLTSYRGNHIRLDSPSAAERIKFQHPYMGTQMCTKTENDYFSSGIACVKRSANSSNTCLRHELCNSSSHSTFMVAGRKNHNQIFSRNPENFLPGFMDGSVQLLTNCYPGDVPFPSIRKECGKELKDSSCSRPLPIHNCIPKLGKLDDFEHVQYLPHKIPKCSVHDPEMLDKGAAVNSMDSTKEGSQMFSDAVQYLLLTNRMGMNLSDGNKMTKGISSEVEETVFGSRMLPTILPCHGNVDKNSEVLINSINSGKNDVGTDSHLLEKQESSLKTDTMYIDASQSSRSPEGATSSKAQKGVEVFPKLTKAEMATTSTVGQAVSRNSGSKLIDINIKHPVLPEREGCVSNRELSTSRTDSMDADHFASNFEKPHNSKPSLLRERPFGQEVNRWIKRLRHCPPNDLALSTKRLKMGDAPISKGTLPFLSKVLNYKEPSLDISTCLKEHQKSDKDMLIPKDGGSSSWESRKTNSWIARWCHKSQQAGSQAQLSVPVLCEPEKSNIAPEILEAKQFPSIAAMALMGKAVRNISPRVFRRRGSSVVWNTGGL